MYRDCLVCERRRPVTIHHYHWPKSHIRIWYPKMFSRLRTIKMDVCEECHKQYHEYAYRHCISNPHRNCTDCKFCHICCFFIRRET